MFALIKIAPSLPPSLARATSSTLDSRAAHPLLARPSVVLGPKMLPTVATLCCHSSLPAAATAAFQPCESFKIGRNSSKSSVSCGGVPGVCGHGGPQVRFCLNHEQGSEARSSDESTSSSAAPVGVVGESNSGEGQEGSGPRGEAGEEEDEAGGGRLGDLSLLQTRRFWLGTSVGALAALGGNLGGVTSAMFNLNPLVSRSVRADLVFPVSGFKRCLETSQGFEFVYPMSWVGDQRLLYRAVERAERERALDLPPIQRRAGPSRASSSGADPVVAFGPPGTDGELNVSVVVAPVYAGFSLEKIGGPQEAGERILRQSIAPEGSKKVAVLLNAKQRTTEDQLYYNLEYTVKGPTFFRHNLSVYTTSSGLLYSLNAQAPEKDWGSVQRDFFEIANSFKLLL